MPQNEITDPIILAAMIEDEDETPEEKAAREELIAQSGATPPSKDDDEDEEEDEDDTKKGKSEDTEDEDDEGTPKPKTDPKKPVEAEDDTEDDVDEDLEDEEEDDPQPKKSRKQKRQERQEDFMQSIVKDKRRNNQRANIPDYKPLDYNQEDKEFKPEELAQDREMVGAVSFAKGAETARYWAEQDQFWSELETEAKILSYDPKLNFLSETTPDGKKNDSFDPDKAAEINEMYLQLAGFKQHPKRDEQGRVLVDNYGRPIVERVTVDRTDLSYDKFARRYVDRMTNWAEDFAEGRVEETKSNITKQRKKQGIRPGSGKRKSIGALQQGDISRMSDEDFEKNEAEIDRQIDAMLGL